MNQPQNIPSQQEIVVSDDNDDEIDLLGLIQTLGEEKWLLLIPPLFFASIAAVISLYLPIIYVAKATFMVSDKQSSLISDQLGGGLGSLAASLSRSSTDLYVGLLRSNAVQDILIEEFDLVQRYGVKDLEDARKNLLDVVKVIVDKKSGLITIVVKDSSAEFAAKLANAYLGPFRKILNRISLEEIHAKRKFFADQIEVVSQRSFRDSYSQSILINQIIRNYEMARMEEARESLVLLPLDVAQVSKNRHSPQRTKIVLLTGAASFFLMLALVILKRKFLKSIKDDTLAKKWIMVREAWRLHS
jgi:tyrosine-protein kinase Etk/Wzc